MSANPPDPATAKSTPELCDWLAERDRECRKRHGVPLFIKRAGPPPTFDDLRGDEGWQAVGRVDEPLTFGGSCWGDDLELRSSAVDGLTVPYARESIELPPLPPPGPSRRLTGWARVKDTAQGVAVVLGWLLFLAYLTLASMPPTWP